MLILPMVRAMPAAGATWSPQFIDTDITASSITGAPAWTTKSFDISAAPATATRTVIVGFGVGGSGVAVSSVTIMGVSATLIGSIASSGVYTEMWSAVVPTGTSGTVVINFSAGSSNGCALGMWTIDGHNPTAHDTATATGATASLDIPANGVGFAAQLLWSGSGGYTATGLDEDFDIGSGNSVYVFGSSKEFATLQTGLTVGTTSAPSFSSVVAVSYARL